VWFIQVRRGRFDQLSDDELAALRAVGPIWASREIWQYTGDAWIPHITNIDAVSAERGT
jgi:hypothetical protein